MALHTELNIHTAAQKLLSAVSFGTLHMRRDAKPCIGNKMVEEALDITTLIQRANIADDKAPHLDAVLEKKCRVEALLQVALDHKLIGARLYSRASHWSRSVGQQASGWKKHSQRRQLHDRQGGHASA